LLCASVLRDRILAVNEPFDYSTRQPLEANVGEQINSEGTHPFPDELRLPGRVMTLFRCPQQQLTARLSQAMAVSSRRLSHPHDRVANKIGGQQLE
jgi:hypothetical protein